MIYIEFGKESFYDDCSAILKKFLAGIIILCELIQISISLVLLNTHLHALMI